MGHWDPIICRRIVPLLNYTNSCYLLSVPTSWPTISARATLSASITTTTPKPPSVSATPT